jgi:uncharacterized hydrophobic protein (TIGR00271 family)
MSQPILPDARMALGAAALDDLFPEGPAFRRSLETFAVLLTLSAFIATFGLYQDSVASIIGAMVVAPLGGTIIAIAGALVTGRQRWQLVTLAQVTLGSLAVVAISFLVSLALPDPLQLNASIEARTSPNLLDLGVALAAGAAGAFVAVRQTGTDALPGVAIAVALVPPLATIGICAELGRWDDAGGATILFLTNMAAIIVAASVVFVASGAAPTVAQIRELRRLRNGVITATVALVALSIPLAWNSINVVRGQVRLSEALPVVEAWIGDRSLRVVALRVDGQDVELDVAGPDAPAATRLLAEGLAATWDQEVDVTVDWSETQQEQAIAP